MNFAIPSVFTTHTQKAAFCAAIINTTDNKTCVYLSDASSVTVC